MVYGEGDRGESEALRVSKIWLGSAGDVPKVFFVGVRRAFGVGARSRFVIYIRQGKMTRGTSSAGSEEGITRQITVLMSFLAYRSIDVRLSGVQRPTTTPSSMSYAQSP